MKKFHVLSVNLLFLFLLYMGYEKNVNLAQSMAIMIAWFCIIISFLFPFLSTKDQIDAGKKICEERTLHPIFTKFWRLFDTLFDFTVVAFLYYHNEWVIGTFYFFHWVLLCSYSQRFVQKYQESLSSISPDDGEQETKFKF